MSSAPRPLPYRAAGRAELLDDLFRHLSRRTGEASPTGHARGLDDRTHALLDAWATVAAVVEFYQERIAAEGYLGTAVEPGSILALAALVGHRPRPGLAASVYLAYTLNADPVDTAVALPAGLVSMSVPGEGEEPQTFETVGELIARPSWNRLTPLLTQPLTVTRTGAGGLEHLELQGIDAQLQPNDIVLLDMGDGKPPVAIRVALATADPVAQTTTVELQAGPRPAQEPSPGATDFVAAGAALAPELRRQPAAPPQTLDRAPADVFGPDSDATPRLLSALEPALASTLYAALATSKIGARAVAEASVLRVDAAPFGAQAAPQPLFDERGLPAGVEEWPLGGYHRLTLRVLGPEREAALKQLDALVLKAAALVEPRRAVVEIECAAGEDAAQGLLPPFEDDTPSQPVDLKPLGKVIVEQKDGALVFEYTGADNARLPNMTITIAVENGAVALDIDGARFVWVPESTAIVRQLGIHKVTIGRSTNARAVGASIEFTIETPLPLADPTVLVLDGRHDGILPLTHLVVERAPAVAGDVVERAPGNDDALELTYPLVRQIKTAAPLTVTRYGITAPATQLELDGPWIDPTALRVSELRKLTIHAQPAALALLPQPVEDDLKGDALDLEGLHAGLQAGRLLIVAGTRTDLPSGARVEAGEVAMIRAVRQLTAGGHGETPHTELLLTSQLAYEYERRSVKIFGNVIEARHGAAQHETLPGAAPGEMHPVRTLAVAPVLADPAPVSAGALSSLRVGVDGVSYHEAPRLQDEASPRAYISGTDATGHTTIAFTAPLPTGASAVTAAYRAGEGARGNVRAHQVTQPLTKPLSVAGVENPLPGSGGADGDGPEAVRSRVPVGLGALGRIVSVADYADLASSWAGIGKAEAAVVSDARHARVLLTIAGSEPVPLDPAGGLARAVAGAVRAAGDPLVPLTVAPAELMTLVLGIALVRDPDVARDAVEEQVRAVLLAELAYARRDLGQDVVLSELIAAAHRLPDVRSLTVTALALLPAGASPGEIAGLPERLKAPVPDRVSVLNGRAVRADDGTVTVSPAQIAFLSGAVRDTLIFTEGSP